MGAPNEDDASYCGEGQANTDALSKILAHRIPPPIARLRGLAPRFGYYTAARQLTELTRRFASAYGLAYPGRHLRTQSVFLRSHIALPYRAIRKPWVRWVNEQRRLFHSLLHAGLSRR